MRCEFKIPKWPRCLAFGCGLYICSNFGLSFFEKSRKQTGATHSFWVLVSLSRLISLSRPTSAQSIIVPIYIILDALFYEPKHGKLAEDRAEKIWVSSLRA